MTRDPNGLDEVAKALDRDRAEALELLHRAPVVRVATTLPSGEPVLRTAPAVIAEGAAIFAWDLPACDGRPAVVLAEEVAAHLPIELSDRRALAEPLLSISARATGSLSVGTGEAALARVPVAELRLEKRLGQAYSPAERTDLLERLWRRGLPGDPRAIELVRAALPETPLPPFLAAHGRFTLHCQLPPTDAPEVSALLDGLYWNVGFDRPALERSHLAAQAWVGARDESGRVVASARAVSDGEKWAWIYDVVVAPALRRSGLGQAVMKLLLDHPAVRGARNVRLRTRDAQSLYARFGFVPTRELPPKAYVSTEMALVRGGPAAAPLIAAARPGVLQAAGETRSA